MGTAGMKRANMATLAWGALKISYLGTARTLGTGPLSFDYLSVSQLSSFISSSSGESGVRAGTLKTWTSPSSSFSRSQVDNTIQYAVPQPNGD